MFILIYIYMHSYEQDLFALRAAILAFTREFSLPKPVHLFTCMVVLKELGKEQGLHSTECLFTQHNKAGSQHSLTRGLYEDVMAHNMVLVLFLATGSRSSSGAREKQWAGEKQFLNGWHLGRVMSSL